MNPTLLDVPTQLETERLLIRCPQPGDGALVYAGVVESIKELRAWPASLAWAVAEPSIDAFERFCRDSHADFLARKGFAMLLILKSENAYVGGSGVHGFDWSVPKCEIGYWCRSSYCGHGLITEAVTAISRFAQDALGARRIISLPDELNTASRSVAERAGYLLEGTMINERKAPDGSLRNTCLYALTA